MTDLDPFTSKVLTAVADTADRNGGTFMVQLPDTRYITVIVLHDDPQPTTRNTP